MSVSESMNEVVSSYITGVGFLYSQFGLKLTSDWVVVTTVLQ